MSTTHVKAELSTHLRWMIRRDLDEVLAIEKAANQERAWGEKEFLRILSGRNAIALVAETIPYESSIVVGFVVYLLHRFHSEIVNLAVHPDYRRLGVGRKLLGNLKHKAKENSRRKSLAANVWETDDAAIRFLVANGFRAVRVVKTPLEGFDVDAYRMVWQMEERS